LACVGSAQKLRLVCTSSLWQSNGTCGVGENCDQPSGVCRAIVPECKDAAAGHSFCAAKDTVSACGEDLVSADVVKVCVGTCAVVGASAACVPATCGDGKVQSGEECDDGNAIDTDACTSACKNAKCGDGVTWASHEECDDGNAVDTDVCTALCKNAKCGDGITWANHEECDDGNSSNTDACVTNCKAATCGDGLVWAGKEDCDYMDPATPQLCSRACLTGTWAQWPMPTSLSSIATYDTSQAGVVLDKVTKLMWQHPLDANTYTWAAAKTYCAGLVLGGYSDWRLPSRIELVSILDPTVAAPGPTIDAIGFPSTPATFMWTASPVAGSTTLAWNVEFSSAGTHSQFVTSAYRVRCVR